MFIWSFVDMETGDTLIKTNRDVYDFDAEKERSYVRINVKGQGYLSIRTIIYGFNRIRDIVNKISGEVSYIVVSNMNESAFTNIIVDNMIINKNLSWDWRYKGAIEDMRSFGKITDVRVPLNTLYGSNVNYIYRFDDSGELTKFYLINNGYSSVVFDSINVNIAFDKFGNMYEYNGMKYVKLNNENIDDLYDSHRMTTVCMDMSYEEAELYCTSSALDRLKSDLIEMMRNSGKSISTYYHIL